MRAASRSRLTSLAATRGPLSAVGLPRRDARFVAPAIAALRNVVRRRELRHAFGVDFGKPQHDGFDPGQGQIAFLEPRRDALQASVAALNHVVVLGSVGLLEDVADFAHRPHDEATLAFAGVAAGRQSDPSESYAIGVAGEACAAPSHQPERPGSLEHHVESPSQFRPSSINVPVLFASSSTDFSPAGVANFADAQAKRFILSEERTFLRVVEA
jgi:hypothetical protein